jgi:pre-rRNA-processing protein TSR3
LSTAEAIAAALNIAGFKDESEQLLSIFTWGHTFLKLNSMLLDNYRTAKDSAEIVKMQNNLLKDKKCD